jgi:nicotinate phosphoribosyltransferase
MSGRGDDAAQADAWGGKVATQTPRPAHRGILVPADDPGLLSPAQASLLIDQYELAMVASYLERGMNQPAIFEMFVRELPPGRDWLLTAGLGPALRMVREMRFGDEELHYLETLGFRPALLRFLERFRFGGEIDAIPEGTIAFAGEPLVRVTAPRIEAQLLETLLLNQINFQTAIATKAARVVLAAGGGEPGAGEKVVDFSPRRDHGVDAAMKAARAAGIAGAGGTSNVAAAMRYGMRPVGTMAHSFVMSFADEQEAFRTFMQDTPENAIMLVDTYDTLKGVRHAIAASRATGVKLKGVRLDSGDLLSLARGTRALLDEAGMNEAQIVASGDLEEHQIARLVAAGAPVDVWGVGTELGTSRDAPALGGVYKLVADAAVGGSGWRPVWKRSPAKATIPGPKQVFRSFDDGVMTGDLVAEYSERHPGRALLERFVDAGELVRRESLATLRTRANDNLGALPAELRQSERTPRVPYPVRYSERLLALTPRSEANPNA